MIITKEAIEARRKSLHAQVEKLQADLNAVCGAIQDCEFWLARLDQPEPEQK